MKNIIIKSKRHCLILILLFNIIGISFASTPISLKDQKRTDSHLDYLISNPVSSLVLYNEESYVHGESPLTLYSDVKCLPMLLQANSLYENIELISIKITSLADENIKIGSLQLANFKNLKYLVFIYAYPSCGNNIDETCLLDKTTDKISDLDEGIQVLYSMSIPQ